MTAEQFLDAACEVMKRWPNATIELNESQVGVIVNGGEVATIWDDGTIITDFAPGTVTYD